MKRGRQASSKRGAYPIVLVSPHSKDSQWVLFEIGALWVLKKRVTPILMYVGPDAIKPIRDVKAFDLAEYDIFQGQLKERIRRGSSR